MVTFKPMIARVSVCFWLSKDYEYDYEDCAMCITLILWFVGFHGFWFGSSRTWVSCLMIGSHGFQFTLSEANNYRRSINLLFSLSGNFKTRIYMKGIRLDPVSCISDGWPISPSSYNLRRDHFVGLDIKSTFDLSWTLCCSVLDSSSLSLPNSRGPDGRKLWQQRWRNWCRP